MYYRLIDYAEPLYRPPSEADSLIIQATIGCTWNRCTFCDMYTSKQFRTRKIEEIDGELKRVADSGYPVRRVFLGDGDALALSPRRLHEVLGAVKYRLPHTRRISAYASARNLLQKSVQELRGLRDAGLELLYVGIESGNDQVLAAIDKGETQATTIAGLQRARSAGLRLSVMIINGVAGTTLSQAHAVDSAKVLNEVQPEYASVLALMLPRGDARFQSGWAGRYEPLSPRQLLQELQVLLTQCELEKTIFRSDHASNYLILKGTLNRDKQRLLDTIHLALTKPRAVGLREEWMRAL